LGAGGPAVALLETALPGLPKRRGKVRDVYDLGDDRLLIVATDRISAYDWVLPTGIPDKGRVLTGISSFWFRDIRPKNPRSKLPWKPNHLISTEIDDAGLDLPADLRAALRGRSMVVKKADVIPFECVVRGYLAGSAWRDYRATGSVCGVRLPPGLVEGDHLGQPIFTPATKATSGHDENVPLDRMNEVIGHDEVRVLVDVSRRLYEDAWDHALSQGLILADTKFEWGIDPSTGELLLVDEILTPDSSRFWPAEGYMPGGPQPSFDKQFVRDWLDASGWDKASPPPPLPEDIVARTREKYVQAYEMLIGEPFPWE
jgi:phosphoribosylaminoimidazole-succinocarboxamide synthase